MRTSVLLAAVASLLVAPLAAHAGRLDIAILQFSDKRDPEKMAEALRTVDLMKISDSDRTETNAPGLRGGNVVFTQSIGINPGGSFASSTRLTNQRADVTGSLNGSNLSVQITILEGVKVGLRKYRQSVYSGSGSVGGGVAQLISVKQSHGKSQTAIKGRVAVITYDFTSIIAARYTP